MDILKIKETCLYSYDLKRAEDFYHDIIGLQAIGREEDRHVFFRAGSSVLLIFNPEYTAHQSGIPAHDGEGRVHMAFEVNMDAYEAAKDELIAKGIAITHEHKWKNGRSFYFNDPDGHVLEIIEGDAIWDR